MRPAQHSAAVAAGWLREGRRVVLASLVAVDGSAPFDVGATMYFSDTGQAEGNVTGGCVESALAQEAQATLDGDGPPGPRLVTYGISDALAGTVGLLCGGTVHVFVHELRAEDGEAALRALDAIVADRPSAVATLIDGDRAGAKLFVDDDEAVGTLGVAPLLDRNVEREARGQIAHGQSVLRRFGTDGATLSDDLRVSIAVHALAPRMVIVGAIDYSAALARIASTIGYEVTIVDPRTTFLQSPRFSASAEVVAGWPDEVLPPLALTPRDAILVFSHDAKLDVPALIAAFAGDAGYIGALGSRKTTADREERLREAGASDADLARLFAPAGLDIGAATVEETALAVLAEVTAARAGRSGASLRDSGGSIRPAGSSIDAR